MGVDIWPRAATSSFQGPKQQQGFEKQHRKKDQNMLPKGESRNLGKPERTKGGDSNGITQHRELRKEGMKSSGNSSPGWVGREAKRMFSRDLKPYLTF